jgi:hypothetical protein
MKLQRSHAFAALGTRRIGWQAVECVAAGDALAYAGALAGEEIGAPGEGGDAGGEEKGEPDWEEEYEGRVILNGYGPTPLPQAELRWASRFSKAGTGEAHSWRIVLALLR